jgi:hypothetical protein
MKYKRENTPTHSTKENPWNIGELEVLENQQ